MAPPWKAFTLASGAVAFTLMSLKPAWSTSYFLATFTKLWVVEIGAWVIYAVFLYPWYFSPLVGLPEPEGDHWLLGQFRRIARDPSGAPMLDWATNIPNEGLIRYKVPLNQERVMPTTAKALSEVLVTRNYDFEKPAMIRWSLGRILGNGILMAEGDEHKRQRKNLMPAFSFRHVKDLYPVFWTKSKESVLAMVDKVRDDAAKAGTEEKAGVVNPTAVLEIGDWASRATLDIIGVAGLGCDFHAIRDPNNHLSKMYQDVFKPSKQARVMNLLNLVLPGWIVTNLPIKRNQEIRQASATIRQVCLDLVREKKEKYARKELTDVDILSVAIESGGFSDDDLVNQLMTFLAAGHETTASAMQWAIYLLCLHPEVQTRLRQEVRERLPSVDSHQEITALDIDHLPYLNAVCNEVLRYYSPVPLTLRQAVVDTSILGQQIPRGTTVVLCPWAINRNSFLWGEDAGRFNPDRWLSAKGGDAPASAATVGSGGASSNYAFLTFLHGPRSCIGQAFAKAEFACLLAAWVGRFEFDLKNKEEYDEKNMVIKGGVTARPANGLWVNAKMLDEW
ncbi:hypothetical protein jhhlp_002306 [Lomentospora prolificans]|uniref:Uncharacterized protein n=1 Tax=Lomentospora prolificans TaxID=41688 RepID=A0A2N3NDW9_9PEZI|nr:hypothetical protein jhhlp_002306 [Lomentospora prolificans]